MSLRTEHLGRTGQIRVRDQGGARCQGIQSDATLDSMFRQPSLSFSHTGSGDRGRWSASRSKTAVVGRFVLVLRRDARSSGAGGSRPSLGSLRLRTGWSNRADCTALVPERSAAQ